MVSVSAAGWPATGERWRLSAAERKAGLAVGSAPWQFPADRLAVWGRLAPVGIAVAVMVCGPWAFKAGTLDSMKKQGGWLPASSIFPMFSGLVLESAVWELSLFWFL